MTTEFTPLAGPYKRQTKARRTLRNLREFFEIYRLYRQRHGIAYSLRIAYGCVYQDLPF